MSAALALAALLVAPPDAPATDPCVGTTCNFATLAPLWARLRPAAEDGAPPVHILQIGDSHTASDALTSAWRDLLQARAGKGGRGVLPAGLPYAGYHAHGASFAMSPGWSIAASFGPGSTPPRPPIGLSGFSLTSAVPGAWMRLSAEPDMAFDRFILCAIGPGSVTLTVGGAAQRLDFAQTPRCQSRLLDGPGSEASVALAEGRVTLTSWASFRQAGGVALSNLGIVGSQLVHFARTDDAVLAEELRSYLPDMIVLAFGTNEGFSPHLDEAAYRATLTTQIARLRRLAPDVPILLLGAPEALTRNPALRSNATGQATDCPAADPAQPPLFAPPGLARVRAIQRDVAIETGVAWWDWYARMGSACAASRWVADGRMRGDYVHLTLSGGRALARLLEDDLEAAEAR